MPKRSTLRLTERVAERLKADGKDAIFWGADTAGFGCGSTPPGASSTSSSPGGRPA